MNTIRLGPVRLIRPSNGLEASIREGAQAHLLNNFRIGTYTSPEAINAIIQHQFTFYDSHLRKLITHIASRDAAQCFLFQYDEATKILHGNNLNERESEKWSPLEGIFRRAVKYIVELICLARPLGAPLAKKIDPGTAIETAFALAENAVHLSEMSNRVLYMFPEQWYAIVGTSEGRNDFTLRISGSNETYDSKFQSRIIRDRMSRDQFVQQPQFDLHTPTHQKYLDSAFTTSFGMSYGEFLYLIAQIIKGSKPAPNGFPTPFIREQTVLSELAKLGKPPTAIDNAIRGFSVRAETLEKENRVIYRPKQTSRAYRRGFFVFPHEEGPHLAFSRSMALECMFMLVNSVCFQYLPFEWQTHNTKNALSSLSRESGKWFEKTVAENLKSLGIVGGRMKGSVGRALNRLSIPESVGELDFLGYSATDNAIVLIEAKMTFSGIEAAFWRDDISEFVTSKKSFASKFRRKITWVKDNISSISAALDCPTSDHFHYAMITLYPCIAAQMIKDFRCISLTEFSLDYTQASGWPY